MLSEGVGTSFGFFENHYAKHLINNKQNLFDECLICLMNTEILEENLLPSLALTQLCSLALSFVGSLVVTYLGNEDRLCFVFFFNC